MSEAHLNSLLKSCPGDVGIIDWIYHCMQEENAQLQKEKDALQASLERLRSQALKRGNPSDDVQKASQCKQWIKDLITIANETPEQSLEAVEKAAIEKHSQSKNCFGYEGSPDKIEPIVLHGKTQDGFDVIERVRHGSEVIKRRNWIIKPVVTS